MKLKLRIISVLLSACFLCNAQQAAPVIKLLNGTSFKQPGVLKYQISSSQVFYYYIGVEELIDYKWREAILDISDGAPNKAAVVRKITNKQVVISSYKLSNIPLTYSENAHVFRFKINYGVNATTINKRVVSSSFKIE